MANYRPPAAYFGCKLLALGQRDQAIETAALDVKFEGLVGRTEESIRLSRQSIRVAGEAKGIALEVSSLAGSMAARSLRSAEVMDEVVAALGQLSFGSVEIRQEAAGQRAEVAGLKAELSDLKSRVDRLEERAS